jgi:hypothetical protein
MRVKRPAGKKMLSVLKVVEASSVKQNVAQAAGSFRWKSESQDKESTLKAIRRKMESRTDFRQLTPGRYPQGCRKESRKLPL